MFDRITKLPNGLTCDWAWVKYPDFGPSSPMYIPPWPLLRDRDTYSFAEASGGFNEVNETLRRFSLTVPIFKKG